MDYWVSTLSAILAVVGLFIDRSKPNFKKWAIIFIILVGGVCYLQINDAKEAQNEVDLAKNQRERLIELAGITAESTKKLTAFITKDVLALPQLLKKFGLSEERAGKALNEVSPSEIETGQIFEANKALEELIDSVPLSGIIGTKIWYYNKEMDKPDLKNAIEALGFTVTPIKPKPLLDSVATNAVWYGPEVSLEEYKMVIISLIRAGIDIQRTGPSQRNLHLKRNVIEVGASMNAAGLTGGIKQPTKSVQQIINAKSFDDLNDFR